VESLDAVGAQTTTLQSLPLAALRPGAGGSNGGGGRRPARHPDGEDRAKGWICAAAKWLSSAPVRPAWRPVAQSGRAGLQRSFHAAGARTLVTSLWSVSDAATRC